MHENQELGIDPPKSFSKVSSVRSSLSQGQVEPQGSSRLHGMPPLDLACFPSTGSFCTPFGRPVNTRRIPAGMTSPTSEDGAIQTEQI